MAGGLDGSEQAERVERFRVVYDATYDGIVAYCRRRAPAPMVEDAVAETFMVAWRRLDAIPPGDEARLWLYGVARRVLANQRRGDVRRQRLTVRARGDAARRLIPADADAGAERLEAVQGALERLNEDDQELVRLVAWEQLTNAEVATVLGCSTNAVAVRLHRARRRLGAALAGTGFGSPGPGEAAS